KAVVAGHRVAARDAVERDLIGDDMGATGLHSGHAKRVAAGHTGSDSDPALTAAGSAARAVADLAPHPGSAGTSALAGGPESIVQAGPAAAVHARSEHQAHHQKSSPKHASH